MPNGLQGFQKGNKISLGKQNFLGHKHTEEAKIKISEKLRKIALERGYIPPSRLGIKSTEEHRRKISESLKGNPNLLGKKHSPLTAEHKRKISEANKGKRNGEKCPSWRGGIYPEHLKIRHSLEMKRWRASVFERDHYTCIWCKAKSGNGKAVVLNADHILPFAKFPEWRFELNNGRTLCIDCHKKTKTFGGFSRTSKKIESGVS